jgi:hypothetical protein
VIGKHAPDYRPAFEKNSESRGIDAKIRSKQNQREPEGAPGRPPSPSHQTAF